MILISNLTDLFYHTKLSFEGNLNSLELNFKPIALISHLSSLLYLCYELYVNQSTNVLLFEYNYIRIWKAYITELFSWIKCIYQLFFLPKNHVLISEKVEEIYEFKTLI